MAHPSDGHLTILLLDDEEGFRGALAGNLRDDGHAVREYATAAAMPPLDSLDDIALLITDYHVPGENGLAFADRFHAAHPEIPVLMITAYWSRQLEIQAGARRFIRLMRKPIDYEEIHELVQLLEETGAASPS
jgi:DNA-binding NtrC family response regulator